MLSVGDGRQFSILIISEFKGINKLPCFLKSSENLCFSDCFSGNRT